MLRTRVISALVMGLGLFLALVLLPPIGWATFAMMVSGIAAWEWARLAGRPGAAQWQFAGVVMVVGGLVASWAWSGEGRLDPERARWVYLAAALFWLLIAPSWLYILPQRVPFLITLGLGLVVLVAAHVALMDLRALGVVAIILVLGIVWVADIAAYFAGKRFGRHKLAPRVSPGKTWEGVGGALAGVACYALAGAALFRSLTTLPTAILALVAAAILLAAISIVGDLFESALKRQAGLKDSGHILPGHGGLLDRIDALLPVLPLAALAIGWGK